MFISSVKRECGVCGCDKNDHCQNICSSCKQNFETKPPYFHEYVDSADTLEWMSQYNLHMMHKSYGGFWL